MEKVLKTLFMALILIIALVLLNATAFAQNAIWGMLQSPTFTQQPLSVPFVNPSTGDIVIDNFEYWDSPLNHGWAQVEPPYPVYGLGIGYATTFNTVLDLQEGSRVLDVYRPSSVFLLGPTPLYPYARHAIRYPCGGCMPDPTDANNIGLPLSTYPIFTFKFRAPLSIEWFDIFEFRLYYTCPLDPYGNYIRIVPLQGPPCAGCGGGYNIVEEQNGIYTITIGREFIDGSWHTVWLDLFEMTGGAVTEIHALEASGQMFRLDDIIFRASDQFLCEPYLFKIGPRYVQFYEPYRYLFFADYRSGCGPGPLNVTDLLLMDEKGLLPSYKMDHMGNMGMMMGHMVYSSPAVAFETDQNVIEDYWLTDMHADPNYGLFDPNAPHYGMPDPNISALLGRDFIVAPYLPIFADPNVRLSLNTGIQHPGFHPIATGSNINQTFQWNATIGGIGANGVEFEQILPLPIDPFDGMPTYIPIYDSPRIMATVEGYGTPFFGPQIVALLEAALYNAGFVYWPGIAYLDFTPYVFEDIILTLEVSNGRTSDYETFPIHVVNYPVENYPPYIEDVDNPMFTVGETSSYALSVIDPDCMIFSLAGPMTTGTLPATSHMPAIFGNFRTDMSDITWKITINGLPTYQYGPWMQSLIDPRTGVISFTPVFEGHYHAMVTATDAMGAYSAVMMMIMAHTSGTWLNHPPMIMMDWDSPQIVRSGEELILTTPEIRVMDPDGDEVYYSCNIGSCGRRTNGDFIWTFTSNFPGFYNVEIFVYDIRGGYAIINIGVEVKPWWSW